MLIPASYYGLTRDVKKRAQKAVRALKAGKSLREAVQADDLIDTRDHECLIVLDGPSSLVGGEPHFHCYLLMRVFENAYLMQEVTTDLDDSLFESSLSAPWSLLGLLSGNLATILDAQLPKKRNRHVPFLNACLEHWPVIQAEGPRYSTGSNVGSPLHSVRTNLTYVLANRGVTMEEMDRYLPAGELAPLVELALQRSGEI